ncbi:MAG TPA: hypothetical protein VKY85_10845 [Candidatus Angelobacter sp.]|nr:hypothetical protein [Candidatus Angelobacter sp.]
MQKLSWLLGVLLLMLGVSAWAQEAPQAELFGGYSYVHSNFANVGLNSNGGSASLAVNPNPWFGVVADFGGYHGSNLTTVTYLFGPRFSYRSKSPFTPFAQVLFGGAHASGSSNAFAMSVGGGLDLRADSQWSWRIVQAEYLLTNFNDGSSGHQHNARISTGVVYRWGGK